MKSSEPDSDPGPLPFGDFLSHLSQREFTIGIDHHLRLQQLLDKTSSECAPEDIKTLLCPIFATDEKEQELFYQEFDNFFEIFQAPSTATSEETPGGSELAVDRQLTHVSRSKKRALIAGFTVVGLLLIGLAVYYFYQKPVVTPPPTVQPTPTPVQSPVPSISASPSPSVNKATVTPVPTAAPTPSTPSPILSPTPYSSSFIRTHRNSIRLIATIVPFVCLLLFEFIRFRRQTLVLERARGRRPPFSWPISVDAPKLKHFNSEQFYRVVRRLRRRQVGEFQRLDIRGTVAATIASGGYPAFRFRADSRFPEYLILIDRASPVDHQAEYFDQLVRALVREGLFLVRYFYDKDPRVCWNEVAERGIFLTDLQKQYPEHRLLLFGDGDKFLDPISGKLVTWAGLLLEWPDRAILTPASPRSWSFREKTLAKNFIVVPALLDGLEDLSDRFESTVSADLNAWQNGWSLSDLTETVSLERLREHLGADVFEWLCACAIYSELHFNLTLFIGSLLSAGDGLLIERKLLRLVHLPWFRSGTIPDELRLKLIAALDPQKQETIRSAIVQLLEKNPPPPKTFAADSRQLEIVVQHSWLNRNDRKKLKQTLTALKNFPPSDLNREYTLLRLETSQTSPLALRLPRRLQKLFFRRGIPALGIRSGARALATVVIMATIWFGLGRYEPVVQSITNPAPAKIVVVNMIPNSLSSESGQDSEPVLAVRSDERLLVGAAYTFLNDKQATKPVYVSTDGGSNWILKSTIPTTTLSNQSLCFAGGNTLYAVIQSYSDVSTSTRLFGQILETDDPTSENIMRQIMTGREWDSVWIQARTITDDRIYVGVNDLSATGGRTATVVMSVDSGKSFRTIRVDDRTTPGQDGPSVHPSIAKDGTVYVAFHHWTAFEQNTGKVTTDIVVSRDDQGGTGTTPFRSLIDPDDGAGGRIVVRNRQYGFNDYLGEQRAGGGLSLAVDPNNSSIVYVAWNDVDPSSKAYTIHLKKSSDRGQTWSEDLIAIPSATNPALAVADNGTVGLLYQQLTSTRWETHLRFSLEATTDWSDTLLASLPAETPKKTFDPYLGDKIALVSVGNHFYGAFSAANTPDLSYFPNGVRFQRNADFNKHQLLSIDGTTPVEVSIDPYFFVVPSPEGRRSRASVIASQVAGYTD